MTDEIVQIGDEYAAEIAAAFLIWAATATLRSDSFDPTSLISSAFYAGGKARQKDLSKKLRMGIKFDLRNPEAEAWIENYAAQEIKYISAAQRQAIKQITLRAFQEGLTHQQQSKLIREHIGLLPQHIKAVQNYRASLGDIDPALADKLEEKYRKKLLKWRADTIGLTESHTAANQGSYAATKGAVKRGVIDPTEWEGYRITTPDKRRCPVCTSNNGEPRELPDGVYQSTGRNIAWVHQRCRCCEGMRRKK